MGDGRDPEAILKAIAGGKVLDAATGAGGTLAYLKEALGSYDELVGIDIVDPTTRPGGGAMFGKDRVRFELMDVGAMSYGDASFDTACIGNSLHHLADPRKALAEMSRVLKPGGHTIVSEMYRDGQSEPQMTHVLLHHWWARVDTALGVVHRETYARADLVELCATMPGVRWDFFDLGDDGSDPLDPETVAYIEKAIDSYLDKAKALPDLDDIRARGEELRARVRKIGFRGASTLLAIGVKEG